MSQQAPCPIEALVDAAGTVSIEKHIDVSPVSQLHIEICLLFFTNRRTTESERAPLFFWSYLTPREVEVKDASTAAVLFDSSELIIDAICSHSRGSFSIS